MLVSVHVTPDSNTSSCKTELGVCMTGRNSDGSIESSNKAVLENRGLINELDKLMRVAIVKHVGQRGNDEARVTSLGQSKDIKKILIIYSFLFKEQILLSIAQHGTSSNCQ